MRKDIFITHQNKIIRVDLDEIILLEASGEYCLVKTNAQNYLLQTPIIKMDVLLSPFGFCRVHRKYIISLRRISFIERKFVMMDDQVVPIGYHFYKNFLDQLNILH